MKGRAQSQRSMGRWQTETTSSSSSARPHSVNLLSVVTNPRDPRPALGALFDESRDAATLSKDMAAIRRIGRQDFIALTNPEVRALYERFVTNLESRDNEEATARDAAASPIEDEVIDVQSVVPPQFFEEQFHLQKASVVFSSLKDRSSQADLQPGGGQSPAPYSKLEDEDENEQAEREELVLSSYLDTVEGALVRQLNKSTDDFFQALSNFQELNNQVSGTVSQVKRLRARIQSMQCDTVQGVLRVPRLACRQTNLITLHAKLVAMRDVKHTCDKVHAAMLAEDYASTVGRIVAAKRAIRDHLKDVRSLRHVAKRLDQFYELAISYMGARWVNFAIASTWRTAHDDDVDVPPADQSVTSRHRPGGHISRLDGDGGTTFHLPSFATSSRLLSTLSAENVSPLVEGLARAGRMSHVLAKFQQRFDEETREIIATVVLEYANQSAQSANDRDSAVQPAPPAIDDPNDPLAQEANGELNAAKLNALSPSAFQGCFDTCLDHVLSNALAAIAVHNFLHDYVLVAADRARDDAHRDDDDEDQPQLFDESRRLAPPVIRNNMQRLKITMPSDFEGVIDGQRPSGQNSAVHANDGLIEAREGGLLTKRALLSLAMRSAHTTRAICEGAVKKMARLAALREDATSKASLVDLKKLWDSANEFSDAIQACAGDVNVSATLRRSLVVQAKAFIERQHARHKNELMTTLDSEKWQQVDVTPERQRALDRLATGFVRQDGRAADATDAAGPSNGVQSSGAATTTSAQNSAGANQAVTRARRELRGAAVDGYSYKVVWSAVRLIEMVDANLAIAASLPALTPDVISRVVDLLRFFESRTRQLVLFAGAIHSSARLKTITARYLGLASQCLSLVVSLAPHIRAAVADQLASHADKDRQDEVLADLDAVTREYRDHHHRILSKFVGIIRERLDASSRLLPGTNWDDSRHQNQASAAARQSSGQSGADGDSAFHSPFVMDVIKNIVNMHTVLSELLPPEQLQEVFTNVFDVLATRITQLFEAHVNPEMPHGRARVVADLRYLVHNVSRLQVHSTNLNRIEAFGLERYGGSGSSRQKG